MLFLLALVPRLLMPDAFVTPDEPRWVTRSVRGVLEGLGRGRLRATFQTGHPGVPTMYLGALGIALDRSLAGLPGAPRAEPQGEELRRTLAAARLPLAAAAALFVAGLYLLLRGPLGEGVAALAAGLVALDPFYLAHSRLLHLDALLAAFATLAALAVARRWYLGGGRGWLVVAGAALALAALTKAPALFLAPIAAVLAAAAPWPAGGRGAEAARRALDLALVGLVAAAVALLIWPALWTAPVDTARRVWEFAVRQGSSPGDNASFFLGAATRDPGPLYYPVVALFRLTPLVLLGLLAALVAGVSGRLPPPHRRLVLPLALFVLLYPAVMSLASKKFDRYLLPAFPALTVIAALGMAAALRRLGRGDARWLAAATPLLLALQAAQVLPLHPYTLAYYNPLLGGAGKAAEVMLVGWGEGLDQAARYLAQKPEAQRLRVVAWYDEAVTPYFPGQVRLPADYRRDEVDYVLFHRNQVQRGANRSLQREFFGRQEPERVFTINGVEMVWLFAVPGDGMAAAQPVGTRFGDALRLDSYGLALPGAPGDPLVVGLAWTLVQPTPLDLHVFVHLIDGSGGLVAQQDARLGGDTHPTSRWQPGERFVDTYRLALPAHWETRGLRLAVGLYTLADLARLPAQGGAAEEVTVYPDRVEIAIPAAPASDDAAEE